MTEVSSLQSPRTGPERAIRVAKTTIPHKLAAAIQQALLRHDACDLVAMGEAATSRTVVAIALASGSLAAHAYAVSCRIYLTSTPSPNGDRPLRGVLFRVTRAPMSP